MLRLFFALWASAATPPAFTDMPSEQALRNMKAIGAKEPSSLSEADGVEWVRARFAWIALDRLQGNEEGALDVFAGCGAACEKWGPAGEWAAIKKWGCARRKEKFCSK